MFHKFRWSILSAAVILALLVSAFPLGAVMAEGEEPAPTETPVTEELPGAQEETPPPVEVAMTVEEVVAQVPEDVVVVPVDPAGVALPLVEEAVAKTYVTGDPVYCPMNIPFGDSLCIHYDTIDEAINTSMTTDFGTVYVEVDYTDTNPAPVIINGSFGPGQAWQFYLIGGVDISNGEIVGRTKLTRQIVVNNVPNFNMENFSITLPEIVQPNPEEEGEAAPAAFSAETTGNISISNSDFNNNPGSGLSIDTNGNVSLYNVQANNNGAGNSISNINGNLYITQSQFNRNQGTGLVASTGDGEIWALCNQAMNNVLVDYEYRETVGGGMYLESRGVNGFGGDLVYGDIYIWCNKASGNGGFGLIADTFGATIDSSGNSFKNNGFLDYFAFPDNNFVGGGISCSELCPSCSGGSGGEEEKPTEGNTQVVIVKVGEGDGTAEIKAGYSTVFKLYEQQKEKERLVQLTALTSGSAPSGSSAVYTPLDEGTLPGPLPEGASLIPWGFNLAITNPDGTSVESLIGYMLVRFYLPEGFVLPGGMRLVIQHFDPATSSWEPMSTAVGGGTAYTFASKPGTYVLTMEPIK
jgi:hypothetical protein